MIFQRPSGDNRPALHLLLFDTNEALKTEGFMHKESQGVEAGAIRLAFRDQRG